MEIGLYLTFSARGWYYSNADSLEVEFYFDLPENALVYDSWLWIGDEIIRGEIMDKWTAAAIYEDIVKRRRDPSILYKRSGTQYELRIFPMLASETRKIKLTYLVSTQWNADLVMASLPTNLLQASRYTIPSFYVLTWLDAPWKNPKILEFPDITFAALFDENLGHYWRADLPSEAIYNTINFTLVSPLNNGIYLNRFQQGSEGIYQLAFLPAQAVDIISHKKVAVLFDYDATKSEISTEEILSRVKST
jgi:Ca-activated chloride channel family protein